MCRIRNDLPEIAAFIDFGDLQTTSTANKTHMITNRFDHYKKKPKRLALILAFVATVILALLLTEPAALPQLSVATAGLLLTTAIVLGGASLLIFLNAFDQGRTKSLLRFDWFAPVLRKQTSASQVSHSLTGRLLRRIVPAKYQSNRETKKRGLIRRGLRKLGISWLASPLRRIVQGICLATFLGLFFYVCWPYSAKPIPVKPISTGWVFHTIENESGEFVLSTTIPANNTSTAGDKLVLIDEGLKLTATAMVGEFNVSRVDDANIYLLPVGELTPELLDAFFTSTGPWSFYQADPTAWPSHYADDLATKEVIPAESFLVIDPLVSLSTAIAARSWVWSLACAAGILLVCILIPRGFCGYLCPLGTTIDLFDWAITTRTKRFQVPADGWWVHIKYYLLVGTLIASVCGVLISGFVAAIPVITRGLLFLFEPLQNGLLRNWHQVPAIHVGNWISLGLFLAVLCLGFLRPRFWCKYVCPSGAMFSISNLFRATERKVEDTCINCNKCIEICPFDAIKPDFSTRGTDCTMCQSCGGVCPTHAIKFVERGNVVELKVLNDPPTGETSLGRRGFMSWAAGGAAAVAGGLGLTGVTKSWGANLDDPDAFLPVRPPGSVPEREFLQMCIRCGECFKACPNNVLQPEGFQQGLEGLWTPLVVADWAGCESSCNACGQVCPTGAIRPLPLEEKKEARMGLAIVDQMMCLPFAEKEACDLCVQECTAAGYDAIEYMQVGTQVDDDGNPVSDSGFLAPVVLTDKCVGCGLCQTRCYHINVKQKELLSESAIIIETGEDYEDRLMTGSYIELHNG